VPIVLKCGSRNFLEPSGLAQACNGIALMFIRYANLEITVNFVLGNTKIHLLLLVKFGAGIIFF